MKIFGSNLNPFGIRVILQNLKALLWFGGGIWPLGFFWAIYVKIRNTMGCERSEHMSSVSLHALTLVNCRKIRFWSKNQQKLAFFCSKLRKWAIFTRRLLQKLPSKFFQLSINPSPRILLQMGSFKVQKSSPDIELFIFVKKSDRNFDRARRNFYQDAIFPQKSTKKS